MADEISRRLAFGAAAGLAGAAALLSGGAAAQTAAPASSLDQIKASGKLRLGAALAEPWVFKDPATNEWRGFSISFGKALSAALGVQLEVHEMAFPTLVAALQAGQVDLVAVFDATPQRALAVDFTTAALVWHAQAVLVAEDSKVQTWEDLNNAGFTIAVPQGSVMETYAKKMAPKATILAFPNNPETVAAFQSGRANAASLFGPALSVLQARMKKGKIVIPTPARVAVSNVAVRRMADKSFRDWVDLCVAYYYNTGEVQVWYEEYLASRNIDPKTVPAVRREQW